MNPLKTLQFILAHPFNRGKPFDALAQYVSWQVRSRLADEVEIEWVEGTRLIVRSGMTGATGNIYCGLHEYRDMAFVLHALRPDDLFVDVGANIGSYTVLASGVCGASSIAIEPDKTTASHLSRNIAANGLEHLVDLCLAAVGEAAGNIAFTSGKDTMNRVASPSDVKVQMVPLASLNGILLNRVPTLIKLDVEGYETPALRGAEEVLAKPSLRAIILETVDAEALAILEKHSFRQCGYDPQARRLIEHGGWHEGGNALFVRDGQTLIDRLQSAPSRTFRGRVI